MYGMHALVEKWHGCQLAGINHPQNSKGSNMYKFILAALVVLAPSVALAGGGGGSKGTPEPSM